MNFSDSHGDDAPQVKDLADEALDYALEHGVSLGVALATLQKKEAHQRGLSSHGQFQAPRRSNHFRDVQVRSELGRGQTRFWPGDPSVIAPMPAYETILLIELYAPEPGETAQMEVGPYRITVQNRQRQT